jgi:hypothetical protein
VLTRRCSTVSTRTTDCTGFEVPNRTIESPARCQQGRANCKGAAGVKAPTARGTESCLWYGILEVGSPTPLRCHQPPGVGRRGLPRRLGLAERLQGRLLAPGGCQSRRRCTVPVRRGTARRRLPAEVVVAHGPDRDRSSVGGPAGLTIRRSSRIRRSAVSVIRQSATVRDR